jgi:hypothetical protein
LIKKEVKTFFWEEIKGGNNGEIILYSEGDNTTRIQSRKRIIKRAVLVLNKNFIPYYITNLRHTFSLLFRESAKILTENFETVSIWEWLEIEPKDGEEYISTVSRKIKIPKIIVADTDIDPKISKPKVSRLGIFIRDGFTCQYCGKKFSPKNLTIDHVIPRSRGGRTEWLNVVTSCVSCNLKKGDRTPEEAGLILIREPRQPTINIINAREIDLKFYPQWEPYLIK